MGRTMRSLRMLLPMVTRALPLLLLFVTFLFINAEVWEVASTLDGGVLWLTVLMFGSMAIVFLLTRLPEELDEIGDEAEPTSLRRGVPRHPAGGVAQSLLDDGRLGGTARREDAGRTG